MSERSCNEIEPGLLVDYVDGELGPEESARVARHLADCERCRATLKALHDSLGLAQVLWEDRASEVAPLLPATGFRPKRVRILRAALLAAGVLIVLGGALLWWRSGQAPESISPTPRVAERPEAPSKEEIRLAVKRAGLAVRQLAAADLLARAPGGEALATERYADIVKRYPETETAAQAEERLRLITERKVQ